MIRRPAILRALYPNSHLGSRVNLVIVHLIALAVVSGSAQAKATPFFEIRVIDDATGRSVPLIELATVNQIRCITDSAGRIAFNEPGLMSKEIYFSISGPGYTVDADSFGYRGVVLKTTPGGFATVRVKRTNIAERLCRLTGQGIYRDTALLGKPVPVPNLNGGVMGQDTAQAEKVGAKILWFWGDTDRVGYPLGNFFTSGAEASIPKEGPESGIEYRYFTKNDGFVRGVVPSSTSLPIWVSGLFVLDDRDLYAYYAQMKSLGSIDSHGYAKWNPTKPGFYIIQTFDKDRSWRHLDGHTLKWQGYVLGNDPLTVRVKADLASILDANQYEAYTCLDAAGIVVRVDGVVDYRWQKAAPPISSEVEARLVKEGKLKLEETHFLPIDEKGEPAIVVSGSVHWNAYRKRYVAILGRKGGKDSFLGEIVYSESDSPVGPFRHAVKIADHPKYSFYNPVHHAFLDRGSSIYFEGTYTAEFSGNPMKTPMYNYNQLLYKLDLNDSRLAWAR